ncbi:MAG: hypothetical protein KAX46_04600 [Chromatiaceae bacterium]|nr:hypothetical protein [Chromatiaceae bacterium]
MDETLSGEESDVKALEAAWNGAVKLDWTLKKISHVSGWIAPMAAPRPESIRVVTLS